MEDLYAATESDNTDGLNSIDLTTIEALTYSLTTDALGCLCACIKLDRESSGVDQANMEKIKSTIIYHERWCLEDQAALSFGENPAETFEIMQWEFCHYVHLREKAVRLYLCFVWMILFLDTRNKWNVGGNGWLKGRLEHAIEEHGTAIAKWTDGADSIRAGYGMSSAVDALMDIVQGFDEGDDGIGVAWEAMIEREKMRTRCLDLVRSWDNTFEAISSMKPL